MKIINERKNYCMKLENEITVEILTTKENVVKALFNNGFKNANVEINNINDAYNMLKLIGYTDLMKISDHISIYIKDNGDELALQFVNDRIYIEIEEKCEHTGKKYESLDYMKSIITNLNLPINNRNYYAKKAEDILNDKKKNQ